MGAWFHQRKWTLVKNLLSQLFYFNSFPNCIHSNIDMLKNGQILLLNAKHVFHIVNSNYKKEQKKSSTGMQAFVDLLPRVCILMQQE